MAVLNHYPLMLHVALLVLYRLRIVNFVSQEYSVCINQRKARLVRPGIRWRYWFSCMHNTRLAYNRIPWAFFSFNPCEYIYKYCSVYPMYSWSKWQIRIASFPLRHCFIVVDLYHFFSLFLCFPYFPLVSPAPFSFILKVRFFNANNFSCLFFHFKFSVH